MLLPIGTERTPDDHVPLVTYLLIVANLVVYGVVVRGAEDRHELFVHWGFTPASAGLVTSVTSTFLHADGWHLFGNLLYLFVFAPSIEWCLGRLGFLAAFLGTAVLGDVATWAVTPHSDVPGIGASGAVSGVLGVFLVAFPRNGVRVLFFAGFRAVVLTVPAWPLLLFWFVMKDLWPLFAAGGWEDGVGHLAHLGGFAGGIAIAVVLRRREAAREAASAAFAARARTTSARR